MALTRSAKPGKKQPRLKPSDKLGPLCGGIIIVESRNGLLMTPAAAKILKALDSTRRPRLLQHLPKPVQKLIAAARRRPRTLLEKTLQLSNGSGANFKLRLTAVSVPGNKSLPVVTLILQDSDSRRRAAENLRRLDRLAALGTLAAGMAHEIKNALVVGKTFFDLLLEKNQDADLVELVRRELARIEALVSQMLRFSSQEKQHFAEVRLHEVLNHSLRMVQRPLQDKGIDLQCLFEASPDLVRGDDFQLEQAFINLLLNAIEAMGPHGTLTVATALASTGDRLGTNGHNEVQIRIQDTGVGIAPENMRRLFAPFFSTKVGGTGLGLSITQGIIQEHGGAIAVRSKLSQGAEFVITLPSVPKSATAEFASRSL